ncbi:hypothetical protein ACFSJQ_19295 [Vibrio olivae]|uniref:Uncharacterized protein n=1 Tax=Vibrio olivae TaxID=1243002 RepID=A0ABV5HMU6_9VIBR
MKIKKKTQINKKLTWSEIESLGKLAQINMLIGVEFFHQFYSEDSSIYSLIILVFSPVYYVQSNIKKIRGYHSFIIRHLCQWLITVSILYGGVPLFFIYIIITIFNVFFDVVLYNKKAGLYNDRLYEI